MMPLEWQTRGLCAQPDVNPEWWFAVPETPEANNAMVICQRCPVSDQCLAWAVDMMLDGIWGGTTDTQRREIRRHQGYVRTRNPSRYDTNGGGQRRRRDRERREAVA